MAYLIQITRLSLNYLLAKSVKFMKHASQIEWNSEREFTLRLGKQLTYQLFKFKIAEYYAERLKAILVQAGLEPVKRNSASSAAHRNRSGYPVTPNPLLT